MFENQAAFLADRRDQHEKTCPRCRTGRHCYRYTDLAAQYRQAAEDQRRNENIPSNKETNDEDI